MRGGVVTSPLVQQFKKRNFLGIFLDHFLTRNTLHKKRRYKQEQPALVTLELGNCFPVWRHLWGGTEERRSCHQENNRWRNLPLGVDFISCLKRVGPCLSEYFDPLLELMSIFLINLNRHRLFILLRIDVFYFHRRTISGRCCPVQLRHSYITGTVFRRKNKDIRRVNMVIRSSNSWIGSWKVHNLSRYSFLLICSRGIAEWSDCRSDCPRFKPGCPLVSTENYFCLFLFLTKRCAYLLPISNRPYSALNIRLIRVI